MYIIFTFGKHEVSIFLTIITPPTVAPPPLQVCQRIMATSQYNSQLVTQHREEVRERRRLHNQLVELRGNIRVMCRVRPAIAEDGQNPEVGPYSLSTVGSDGVCVCR